MLSDIGPAVVTFRCLLIGNVNKFIGNYSTLKNCSKRKLFQSYCTSFYGSELWSLSSKGLEECCIAWRKCARRIFNMSYQTHLVGKDQLMICCIERVLNLYILL